MSSCTRPSIDTPVFVTDRSGHRLRQPFGAGHPPEDTYSVDTHPERFAPVHTVADALIADLVTLNDVSVEEGRDGGDLLTRLFTTWAAP